MASFQRVFLIILDSVGIGGAYNEKKFNDYNVNTLLHTIKKTSGKLPNLEKMGLLNLIDLSNTKSDSYYMKANCLSNGKDTLTGHWEMMGILTKEPFKTFTETGFPKE